MSEVALVCGSPLNFHPGSPDAYVSLHLELWSAPFWVNAPKTLKAPNWVSCLESYFLPNFIVAFWVTLCSNPCIHRAVCRNVTD